MTFAQECRERLAQADNLRKVHDLCVPDVYELCRRLERATDWVKAVAGIYPHMREELTRFAAELEAPRASS